PVAGAARQGRAVGGEGDGHDRAAVPLERPGTGARGFGHGLRRHQRQDQRSQEAGRVHGASVSRRPERIREEGGIRHHRFRRNRTAGPVSGDFTVRLAPPATGSPFVIVPSTGWIHSTGNDPSAPERSIATSPPSGRKTTYSTPDRARQYVVEARSS